MPRVPYFKPTPSASISRVDPQSKQRQADCRFYNAARWRKVRALKLDLNPLCERCEKQGLTVVAAQVHHIKARKTHPDLAYDVGNLEALCRPCHTREEKTSKPVR